MSQRLFLSQIFVALSVIGLAVLAAMPMSHADPNISTSIEEVERGHWP